MMKNAMSFRFGTSVTRKDQWLWSIRSTRKESIQWIGVKQTQNLFSPPAEIIAFPAGIIPRKKLPSAKAPSTEGSSPSNGPKNCPLSTQSAMRKKYLSAPSTTISSAMSPSGIKCQWGLLCSALRLLLPSQNREDPSSTKPNCPPIPRITIFEQISKLWTTLSRVFSTRNKISPKLAVW